MSGHRISIQECVAHLRADLATTAAFMTVGSTFDRNYQQNGQKADTVWVGGQRSAKMDNSGGGAGPGAFHAMKRIEIPIRFITTKNADGQLDGEPRLIQVYDAIELSVRHFKPAGIFTGFSLDGSQDGTPTESVCYCNMIFSCTMIYSDRPQN